MTTVSDLADFYRWLYCMPFNNFCKHINKPENDLWAIEKFKKIKQDFGSILCNNTDLIEQLYKIYLNDEC